MSEITGKQYYRLIWKRGIWYEDQQFVIDADALNKYEDLLDRSKEYTNSKKIDFISYQIDNTSPPIIICNEVSFGYVKERVKNYSSITTTPELVLTLHSNSNFTLWNVLKRLIILLIIIKAPAIITLLSALLLCGQ